MILAPSDGKKVGINIRDGYILGGQRTGLIIFDYMTLLW